MTSSAYDLQAARGGTSRCPISKRKVSSFASTKSHASGKIKNPYFGILSIASDVFFDADSESPHMTLGKNATLRSYRRKTAFSRSRDQCAANWCTNFN